MRISDLKLHISTHQWRLDHIRILSDKKLLITLLGQWCIWLQASTKRDHQEFTAAEAYPFVAKLLRSASPMLIQTFKESFLNNNQAVTVSVMLHRAGLFNPTNFELASQCNVEQGQLLYTCLQLITMSGTPLTQALLNQFFTYCLIDCHTDRIIECVTYLQMTNHLPRHFNDMFDEILLLTPYDFSDFNQAPVSKANYTHEKACIIVRILSALASQSVPVQGLLKPLMRLSPTVLRYLEVLTSRLHGQHMLNSDAFSQALYYASLSLPGIRASSVTKWSRKTTRLSHSEYKVGGNIHFFSQHDVKYPAGSYGKVKKGFSDLQQSKVTHALKMYTSETHKTTIQNVADALREARREAKYNHLFHRQVAFFQRVNKVGLVMEYFPGSSLTYALRRELRQISDKTRVCYLVTGFSDLLQLTSHHRIHGDIRPGNFMLDRTTASMRLIDFGFTHKPGSRTHFEIAPEFSDGYTLTSTFYDDIYSMGYIVAFLFPEFFTINAKGEIAVRPEATGPMCAAMQLLVEALRHPIREQRCRVDDALVFCMQLYQEPVLDAAKVKQIAAETIQRATITVDDVLEGRMQLSL